MTDILTTLDTLAAYFRRNRQKGHTWAACYGAKNQPRAIVLCATEVYAKNLADFYHVDTMGLGAIARLAKMDNPLVLDNYAVVMLCHDAALEIRALREKVAKLEEEQGDKFAHHPMVQKLREIVAGAAESPYLMPHSSEGSLGPVEPTQEQMDRCFDSAAAYMGREFTREYLRGFSVARDCEDGAWICKCNICGWETPPCKIAGELMGVVSAHYEERPDCARAMLDARKELAACACGDCPDPCPHDDADKGNACPPEKE